MFTAENFLTREERQKVGLAVGEAEQRTSAEIRIHLEDHIEEDVLEHAAFIFEELGMHRTADRNGILIYVCVTDRQMAVVGDKAINERVPAGFWDHVIENMRAHFSDQRHAEGLIEAVREVGELAGRSFPRQRNDQDELSNEVSFSRK